MPKCFPSGSSERRTRAKEIHAQQRATYTCIGDTVNLAARLEAHTKAAGHNLLIDGATRRAVDGNVPIQSLGEVPFKGKAAAVEIFAATAGQRN